MGGGGEFGGIKLFSRGNGGGGGNQSSPTEYKGGYRKLTANQLPTMERERVIIRILQSLSRKRGGGGDCSGLRCSGGLCCCVHGQDTTLSVPLSTRDY